MKYTRLHPVLRAAAGPDVEWRLNRATRDAAQNNQEQDSRYERSPPDPILKCLRVTFAAHDAHCKLPERPHVCVKEKPRHAADRSPKHVGPKTDSRQSIKVVQQTGRK